MKKIFMILLLAGFNQSAFSKEPQVVEKVELNQYLGRWFEIARLPIRFQKSCVKNTMAQYKLIENGIAVENSCITKSNKIKKAIGVAKIVSKNNNKLQVNFAPKWLSWLPATWGDYWVLYLGEIKNNQYQTALVGTPDKKYLWLLSRHQKLNQLKINQILQIAKDQGFAIDKLIFTEQD